MRWLTGGSSAIVVCAVVVGCAGVPGRPTAQRVDAVQSTGSVPPGRTAVDTPGGTPGEPSGGTPQQPGTRPEPPVSHHTTPYVPPRKTDLPGVPGSPITYDVTELVGLEAEVVRQGVAADLRAANCGADLCGIRIVTSPPGSRDCVESVSPPPVYPGGTVTIHLGARCFGETTPDEVPPDEVPPELPVDPTPDPVPETATPETATPETATPETATPGTTGSGR
ncbi:MULTISPECIES: hypothetical protein [Saccharothrix]|uniref:hypothetical protein n=1 Tax=Saccharothrix TaxID=2071 RepID=UPI00093F1D89|nr:hypothetical protein [Saccharothrix sp. CB00851]OKI36571.1 hypothetical protein A6A25_21060 [Saccharothrix sp. CB00851]